MTYELYLVTNKINGKRYVGQTQSNIGYLSRWSDHCNESLHSEGHQGVFHSAIKGYGIDAFEVHRIFHDIPEDKIDELESLWIRRLNTFYVDGWGYNMTLGGQGVHGYQHTSETRSKISTCSSKLWDHLKANPELLEKRNKKISAALKNRVKSEEHRRKLREAAIERFKNEPGTFLGKHHTEETKQKISRIRSNQKASEETKHKMVLTRGTPVQMIDSVTDKVLHIFEALSIAQAYLLSIGATTTHYATDGIRSACHTGKIAYGYRWKFLGSVTTNPDECKDVGEKISYSSKSATKINLF